jgi:hypothetical protein
MLAEKVMRDAAEAGLIRFRYESALNGKFDHVHEAYRYYNNFTRLDDNRNYLSEALFSQNVREHASNLQALAKKIDADVNRYWRHSLAGLLETHRFLCALYQEDRFRDKWKGARGISLNSKVLGEQVAAIETDISKALKKLPTYEFSNSLDVRHWSEISDICIPVIDDTCEIHKRVCTILDQIDNVRTPEQKRAIDRISNSGLRF